MMVSRDMARNKAPRFAGMPLEPIGVFIPKEQALAIIGIMSRHMTELQLAAAIEETELLCEQNGWLAPAVSPQVRAFGLR
jgi:hypothetical protein